MDNNNSNLYRELASGTTLNNGKYTVESVIGSGGFGITYRARQNGLNRTVAIKEFFINGYCVRHTQTKTVIVQGMKEDVFEKYRQKFTDEARILANLKHPNIVEVIEIFDENNTSYMIMPFVEGQTLQKTVETRKTLDYKLTVNYLSQIAEAVGYIHSKNILHRDIKPDNIIITSDQHAILIDFGSAREFVHDKTQAQTSMLTQGYAPLEQYDTVSRKGSYTDIYALGAVFYFALTGQKPLESTTRTMEKMPEPVTLNTTISEDVNRTILKAMAMKPVNRHQTVTEFMDDLLGRRPSESFDDTATGGNSRKWIWILSLILVAGGIITGVIINNNIQENKENNRIIAEKNKIIEQSKVVTDSIALNTVFWDNNGQEYHLFKDCPHLSGEISEGTVEQAFGDNNKQLCLKCVNQVAKYKVYGRNARLFYDSAKDWDENNFQNAEVDFKFALENCNKVLKMRPDNKRINDIKKDIISKIMK